MLGFCFLTAMIFFSYNVLNVTPLKCFSMNNQVNKIKTKIIKINNNEHLFYPYNTEVNKCSSSCNDINEPYSKICVPEFVKNINVKVFNLMSITIETRHVKWHETCKCKCRLDASVSNNKQYWNNGKCRCEFKELIDSGRCDEGFI